MARSEHSSTWSVPSAPAAPVLVASGPEAVWLSPEGEITRIDRNEAARRAALAPPLVCHAPATASALGVSPFRAYDLLELFAFARPVQFCVPTPAGLAAALEIDAPATAEDTATALNTSMHRLLAGLRGEANDELVVQIARCLSNSGWMWSKAVMQALDAPEDGKLVQPNIWPALPQWRDEPPPPPPKQEVVTAAEAQERLGSLLGPNAEARPTQKAYAREAARSFAPRNTTGQPHIVLAEAGTGIGKTLGYLAPATIWAEKNRGSVWISTYTRNLQRQIDHELDRLFPDPEEKIRRVIVRKGRENYLCLLNLEEELRRSTLTKNGIGIGLVTRWILASRDGDFSGDFPAWLVSLVGAENTVNLADQRGECIYSACPHYDRCPVERAQRNSRHADLVIANHALVLITAAQAEDERALPSRFVFDEGHHLFDAADSAFSSHLTAREAAHLRRWIRGPEGSRHTRARGLEQRFGNLTAGLEEAEQALKQTIRASAALPGLGSLGRLRDPLGLEEPGPGETFFSQVREYVLDQQTRADQGYSLEASLTALPEPLRAAATGFREALSRLSTPMGELARTLTIRLDTNVQGLEAEIQPRIDAARRSLTRRIAQVETWREMLEALDGEAPKTFIDWFSIDRSGGREFDVGQHRHFLDPTAAFSKMVLTNVDGALITSASLRDHTIAADDAKELGDIDNWLAAEVRTGAHHLAEPARRVSLASPFDYAQDTRIFLVKDVHRSDTDAVSAALYELFVAAGGGAVGLFTAVSRLRATYRSLISPLAEAGLPLLAQHVDPIDTGTLVDIFRADTHACLLGTDAVRDGVDVPGRSLRLIAFDRVPWPRPDILHRARKQAFGGSAYDDLIARLRLRQAFGRLLRRAGDHGVFVLLDDMAPSRLLSAFPREAPVRRVGIAEAITETRAFLQERQALADPGTVP